MTVFGTTTVGGTTDQTTTAFSKFGNVYTAPITGRLAAVWVWCSTGSAAATFAPLVYAASSLTVPTSLVGSGATVSLSSGKAAGWVRCPITNGGSVTAGSLYLIGIENGSVPAGGLTVYNVASGGSFAFHDDGGASFPTPNATWANTGTGGTGVQVYSFFAEIVDVPKQQSRSARLGWFPRRSRRVTPPVPAPPSWVQQTQRDRLTPPRPRRSRTASPIPPGAPVVTTQALPPQQPATVRHGWLPRRRARGTNFVPAQVITVQALPPQPARRRTLPSPRRRVFTAVTVTLTAQTVPLQAQRDRLTPQPRRKTFTTTPPWTATVTVPQPSVRRRFPVLRAKARTAQPPVTVSVTVPQQPASVRHGWLPRAKRRTAQPPFTATTTVTTQALPPQQPAAVRHGWLPRRRARGTNYIPPQVVVATTQVLPPQPVRDRIAPVPRRRGFTARPLPVTVTVTTQALPPQTGRDRLTPQPRRKAFTTGLLPTVRVTVPTVTARQRVFLPARRGHAASPPVTVTVAPPPATPTRRRLLPIPRRAHTGQFVPQPVAIVTIQVLPPQPVAHARRGWLKRRRTQTGAPPVTTGLASIRLEYLGVPTLSWQADAPTASWRAASPGTSWAAGEPETSYQAGEPETTWTTAPPTMREPT